MSQENSVNLHERTLAVSNRRTLYKSFWFHRWLYLMLIPPLIYYVVFRYLPMYGVLMAFKDFNIVKGILRSPWAGLKHFEYIFSLPKFRQVFTNTVIISFMRLFFGFPVPIIAALLMNEVRRLNYKRVLQTAVYLPHFVSWVILGGILVNLLSADYGVVNQIIEALGMKPIGFLTDERYFRWTLVFSMIWKEFGWGTVIYLAALAGIDPQLYEAALMDGANRWQRTWHITMPFLRSTIIVLLILRLGRMMEAGFEQIFILYHPAVYRVADILGTYVYRIGITEGRFSMATAVGLFRSVINLVLLVSANKIARAIKEQGIY